MISRNRIRCKNCKEIIESKYRHDFVSCKCGQVSVDGGLDYLKRCWDPGAGNLDLGFDAYGEELSETGMTRMS